MVTMHDSKSCAARFVGSSPTSGTKKTAKAVFVCRRWDLKATALLSQQAKWRGTASKNFATAKFYAEPRPTLSQTLAFLLIFHMLKSETLLSHHWMGKEVLCPTTPSKHGDSKELDEF